MRKKKINMATGKKIGTSHEQKKKEKFSDLFNKYLCLFYARPGICQYGNGLWVEDAVVCPANRPQSLGASAAWGSGHVPLQTFLQQRWLSLQK